MEQKLRILFLDQSRERHSQIQDRLKQEQVGFHSYICADRIPSGDVFDSFKPDVVLLLDDFGAETVRETVTSLCDLLASTPLIVIVSEEDTAVRAHALSAGAFECLASDQLDRLEPALKALYRHREDRERRDMTETVLREREETLRLITDNVSDLIAVIDMYGRRVYNSPSYKPILGDTQALRGTDSFAEIHPEDRERIRQAFETTVTTGEGQRTEYRMVSVDGTTRFIESLGNVVRDNEGRPSAVIVVSRDITERKKSEEELRQSEARFRTLFEHSSDAVALVGRDGKILYESPSVDRVLGYTPEDLIGVSMFDLMHPDERSEAERLFLDLLSKPSETTTTQVRIKDKDGSWRWIEGVGTNLLDDPLVGAIVINYKDVGERKTAEMATEHSLSLMKATLESTADGILVVNRDGGIVTYNEQFIRMWKIPREVLQSKDDEEALRFVRLQLKDPEQFLARVQNLYAQPDQESVDLIEFLDGRVFERLSKPQLLKETAVGRVWSFRDITQSQISEKALHQAKENYEGLVNTIDGIVWEADPESMRFTFVSEPARRLLGFPPDEWLQKGFWENRIHPDDKEWVLTYSRESTRNLRDHEFEFRMVHLDGHILWLRDIVSIIVEGGKAVKLRGVMVDVTEKKRTEQLNDAVYRIAQAADNARNLDDLYVRVHTIIGEVMPAQNFYIALYNRKRDLLSFPYFVDEVDDRPEPKRPGKGLTEYVLRKGVSLLCDEEHDKMLQESGETELIGVYSPVWLGVPLILDHETIGVMVVQHYSDPTAYGKQEQQILEFVSSQVARTIDRKRSEEVLRENEERYRIIAEQTGQLVYDYDVSSGQIRWSGAIASMTGYHTDEFQEIDISRWEQHIHPDDREHAVQLLNEALSRAEKYDVEYRFCRKDGSYIHVQDHGVFLKDQNNKAYRMLGTMNDITERKQLEGQLVQSQKMEAVGQLASGIAHDFNNVMGVVLTATHLIKTVAANEAIDRYTNMIEGATMRGSAIAKQLLQFSRAEASRLMPISLSHVVTEVKKILDHSFPKTLQIVININVDHGVVMGDESQIHQVLLNLCINARDAMTSDPDNDPQGTLTIDLESVNPATFLPGAVETNGQEFVALRVRDNGSGITEEVRRRMFDPFFTTKEIGKGTGLGLSIVHGIVTNHHAYLDVDSIPGQGTTFSIYFPLMKHEVKELAAEIAKEEPGGGETILVIEDENPLRELMREILSKSGYKVLEARDGMLGVEEYERSWQSIDLVLSDIGLPRLSGEGVLKRLEEINPEVKLIFCTGFLDGERRAELLRRGAIEVIHKPYRVSEILSSVRRAMRN